MAIGQERRCEITETFKITSSHKYFIAARTIAFSGRAEFLPHTGRAVRSTIRTDRTALAKLGDLKISVWCPVCEAPHKIACNEASLVHSLPLENG